MAKKTLVTGATGTIGREVTKHLAAQGVSTRAGVRDRTKARKQFGDEIELVAFAFEDKRLFADALEDVEKVFLLPPLMLLAEMFAGLSRLKITLYFARIVGPMQEGLALPPSTRQIAARAVFL